MSYILDALKRADAERGLTAGAATTDAPSQSHEPRPPAPWWRSGVGVLALAAVLSGLAGLAVLRWPATKVATTVESAPPPPPPSVPMPVSPPAPEPPPPVVADAQGRPVPILLPERPKAAQPAAPAPAPAVPRQPAPSPKPPPPARPAATPSAPVATAAPASAPPVKVTGATYSDNPAHRMLIVNGKIVLEGQDIEPGLKLEVITPHSAVLNHQGSRYNINY